MSRAAAALLALLALLLAADAFWLEPHRLLLRDEVELGLADAGPLTAVHLSDLHVAGEGARERRLLAAVAAEHPDLVLVSGDFVRDSKVPRRRARYTAAAARLVSELRRLAPVLAVQGHSEYRGEVVAALADAGVDWLDNQGRLLPGGILLLGLDQQVGDDRWVPPLDSEPFATVEVEGQRAVGHPGRRGVNVFFHYDPAGGASRGGDPLAWSGYRVECDLWLAARGAVGGIALHSQYVAGADRLLLLRWERPDDGGGDGFELLARGTALSAGKTETGVVPEAGRWYRLRLSSQVRRDVVRFEAWVWPADQEPPAPGTPPQAWAEDRSPRRLERGTVGLWARSGAAAFRNLVVTAGAGTELLREPFDAATPPAGWRTGTRGSRLEMALARSPRVPPGTPRLVLTHTPGVVLEAARRGVEAVLAGHTHGGQVRLPGGRAILTRSSLGTYYDRGLFAFAAPNRRGFTSLYVNSGVGTSLLPVRFLCPPRYAVVELGSAPR
jgi:predicted MPP superfamily phosphohydrolase